jgi:hypothetical protein
MTSGGLPLTSLYAHARGMRPSGTSDARGAAVDTVGPLPRPIPSAIRATSAQPNGESLYHFDFNSGRSPSGNRGAVWTGATRWFCTNALCSPVRR